MLKKCKATEKIEKDDKGALKCVACPAGRKAGGKNLEKCDVDFDLVKFKAADTKDVDAKKTLLGK
jgi:hypothetical protein